MFILGEGVTYPPPPPLGFSDLKFRALNQKWELFYTLFYLLLEYFPIWVYKHNFFLLILRQYSKNWKMTQTCEG